MNTQPFATPSIAGTIAESAQRDQFNVLLWASLAGMILGLPSPNKSA
jgi:hypothetical protein